MLLFTDCWFYFGVRKRTVFNYNWSYINWIFRFCYSKLIINYKVISNINKPSIELVKIRYLKQFE